MVLDGRGEYKHFPRLSTVSTKQEDLLTYFKQLEVLHVDFMERFQDILNINVLSWVLDPFANADTEDSSNLKEELVEPAINEQLKVKFKNGTQEFWLQKLISVLYSGLCAVVLKFSIVFPSSYLAERVFSAVANLLSKKRNRLHITEHGDLQLMLTQLEH
ncbi:unnamed protein product [Psylliodes chrysocephalus]|uniref:HAT C-terminal dimerisation domain-containing protein n=1 Tax=Psylliodes chrysocephalus TaxID=3402493 RepID=A0A9P0DAD4_9CUCU|nr:unnamed protein product [Psylliodes chrysocephala]